MRGRAVLGDADSPAFELLIVFDVLPRHDSLQSFAKVRRRDHGIGSPELRTDRAFAAADGEVEISRQQSADDSRPAATDEDDFHVDSVFFEKSLFVGNPKAAVGGADGAMSESDFILCGGTRFGQRETASEPNDIRRVKIPKFIKLSISILWYALIQKQKISQPG